MTAEVENTTLVEPKKEVKVMTFSEKAERVALVHRLLIDDLTYISNAFHQLFLVVGTLTPDNENIDEEIHTSAQNEIRKLDFNIVKLNMTSKDLAEVREIFFTDENLKLPEVLKLYNTMDECVKLICELKININDGIMTYNDKVIVMRESENEQIKTIASGYALLDSHFVLFEKPLINNV